MVFIDRFEEFLNYGHGLETENVAFFLNTMMDNIQKLINPKCLSNCCILGNTWLQLVMSSWSWTSDGSSNCSYVWCKWFPADANSTASFAWDIFTIQVAPPTNDLWHACSSACMLCGFSLNVLSPSGLRQQ